MNGGLEMTDKNDKFERLVKRLREHPLLADRIDEILDIVDNEEGISSTADQAEEGISQQMKKLGHEALETWASQECEKQCGNFKKEFPRAQSHIKKNSTGTPPLE